MESAAIENIAACHAEEAAFLWLLRDKAVYAPHYSLGDLAKLDGRVEAHLDGLHVAGDTGWALCMEALKTGEAGEVFAAAVLAFESGDEARIRAVLGAAEQNPESCPGLVSALGWLPYEEADSHISKLIADESPLFRCVGLSACVAHRRDPGRPLTDALTDENPLLKARALEAVGQLGRIDLLPFLRLNLSAEDDLCRFNAAWSAALLGDAGSAVILKTFVNPDWPWREEAMRVALRRTPVASALDWQRELAGQWDFGRLSIIGTGVVGDPVLIPWLIDQMKTPEFARLAGESLSMITGVDIAYEDLEGEWPEGFEAGPTDDPEDENVDMDPDEDLPWPNPELIACWWQKNKANFKTGNRYLLGLPITAENLHQVLRTGRQRQRHAAALELAMMTPGQPLFEVRAPGFRQKKMLGVK